MMLPHVTAFNVAAAPEAEARIGAALDSAGAVTGLQRLYKSLDAPLTLQELGLREDRIAESVDLILPHVPPSNPRSIDAADLERLLHSAWKDDTP
ncbi:alcohol dehydrogenase class IV [Arthrobacter ginsengisoli]|uniref:Alcohol dehydrogenase class IV n=1 Tax=Arthrobacter ginsengisoli TaxID=1356565 RepID=A0ABU1UGG9_9MICC|nr:alcohol dehydrogenase class IV [Arthrobacter ginsengisoli]